MMMIWTTIYAQIVSKVIASYIYDLGLTTNQHLSDNIFYSFILVGVLLFLGFKSQKLLIKTVSLFSLILFIAIVVATFALIPFWDVKNLTFIPEASTIVPKLIILIPFSLTAILFIQSLSPMVIGYKKEYNTDLPKARTKAVYGMAVAFVLLSIIVLMFIVSFTLAIPHDLAIDGKDHNTSAFLLISNHGMSNIYLVISGALINIFAILTSFLSILAGMKNSLSGIMLAVVKNKDTSPIALKLIDKISVALIFLLAWSAIVFNLSIYKLVPLSGPIFGILGCLIPVYLVYKIPNLNYLKSKSLYYILFVGIVLIISPFLSGSI
jgi:amino acid permease